MRLTVNGTEHDVLARRSRPCCRRCARSSAITSPKAGCQQGGCGACTVLVDGQPRRSCLLPLAAVEGAEVTTVEGIGERRRALHRPGRLPRALRRAVRLLHVGLPDGRAGARRRGADASREEVGEALGGHVCRCTGYVKIVDAVQPRARRRRASRGRRAGASRVTCPGSRMKAVGARLPRYDGVAPRHGPHAVRRRRPRARPAVGEGRPLAPPPRRDHVDRHQGGRGAARRARDRHRGRRAPQRLRPPRGPRRPGRRAAARRGRGPLEGPGRSPPSPPRPRRSRRPRPTRCSRLRGAARGVRHPRGRRPRPADVPPVGRDLSALRPAQPPARPQGRRRRAPSRRPT